MEYFKELIMHNTKALLIYENQHSECTSQFREGGLRGRRRFFECIPAYLAFVGKSLEDVHREIESFEDWHEVRPDDDYRAKLDKYFGGGGDAAGVGDASAEGNRILQLLEEDRLIMEHMGFTTKAELDAYYESVTPGHTFQGQLLDAHGIPISQQTAIEDSGTDSDSATKAGIPVPVETVCEEFLASFGELDLEWLPESQWKPRPGQAVKFATIPEDPIHEASEDADLGEVDASGIKAPLRVTDIKSPQDFIEHYREKADAAMAEPKEPTSIVVDYGAVTLSRKEREIAIGSSSKRTREYLFPEEGIYELRHTWHEKAKMVYWQAEALYTAKIVQDEIQEGLKMAHRILRQAGWEHEFEEFLSS